MIRRRSERVTGRRRRLWTLPAIMVTVAICVSNPATAQDAQTATYTVTFTGNWTTESTPDGVVAGAHFTTLIGAIHNSNVTFWHRGGTASAGIERMAETGATSALRAEIEASPHVHAVIQQRVSFGGTGTATFDIDVPDDHPLITLTSMIGPSPDWFVGISGLSLLDGQGDWERTVNVNLYPYDAGTEDGTEFTLSNPDTVPQGTIESIRGTGKFSDAPMARLSFVLDTMSQPPGRVTGVAVTPGTGVLTVSWIGVDDADGYKVQWRSGDQTFGSARERVVDGSTTEDTIPNLTPGVLYFVRVIATSNDNGDGTPSTVVSGTPLAAENQPPETTHPITAQFLEVGRSARIDLSNHFRDPEGRAMTFSAVSDNPTAATAMIQGSILTIRAVARGSASITVTARDDGDLTTTQRFDVIVPKLKLLADGDPAEVDLTALFTGAEGKTLTYAAESTDPELVAVRVDGTNLVLLPNAHGEGGAVTVTVTATDEDGLTARLSFVITVEPSSQGFLRGWRKGLFER